MYANTGYLYKKDVDLEDLSKPLIVENCGTYRLHTIPLLKTERPCGRRDYQLIYIASGKAHFVFDEIDHTLCPGHMILYCPHIPQHYIYYGRDVPEVYWVHFTGSAVSSILKKHGLFTKTAVLYTGTSPEYPRLFRQMIQELQTCPPSFEDLTSLLFEQILLLAHRHSSGSFTMNTQLQEEMEAAVEYFNENFYKPMNIAQYARTHNMSISWFIRSFKQYTGMPPIQYVTSVRIANAQTLLESSDYTVKEIAAVTGYDNPLYFSRLFKKYTGTSPIQYRKDSAATKKETREQD